MNRTYGNSGRKTAPIGRGMSGMTMIELMIVLVVIAILVALAYPSYIDYVRKARRGEAQQLLLNWAINEEIFRSNNTTYADDDNANLPKPDHDYYTFLAWSGPSTDDACGAGAGSPTATTYLLRAVASGDQANDETRDGTSCASLCLDSGGQKTPAACWD